MKARSLATDPAGAAPHGYASAAYAEALAEFGTVLGLPRSGGHLLGRTIPGANDDDAMGCYPLFACRDWSQLPADIEGLADRVVSVSLVTDPFAAVSLPQLQATFPDVCFPYKEHYVTDLSLPLETLIDPHHRRNIRKANACMEVEIAPQAKLLDEWRGLYDNLIERHRIVGIAQFSPHSFRRQFAVPGFTAFVATDASKILGMTLWYVQGDVAYYHLGAYSDEGYQRGASFAIFNTALSHFQSSGVGWAALGAGAGVNAADSGLTRFKKGWSTGTRTAFFCGRILQPVAYESLCIGVRGGSAYFPRLPSSGSVMTTDYRTIIQHYEACLAQHGDSHLGVDWPNATDADLRYRVMLDLPGPPSDTPVSLLDFGCGAAHLYDYIQQRGLTNIEYIGLDASHEFIDLCRRKHPQLQFHAVDVLATDMPLPEVDYIVMNGVLTEKRGLSFEDMQQYMQRLLLRVFPAARIGLAFNVMSKHVDWERDDLFHVPFDLLADFLKRSVSRHFQFRADYGLYEYTTYVYREPR